MFLNVKGIKPCPYALFQLYFEGSDTFVRRAKESKIMDCLTLTKKALRLFEFHENTRARIESHIS